MSDPVIIAEYNPQWPLLFRQEAERIRNALSETAITRIEHFGSTAVPGLAAKPVIDLLIGVHSLVEARQTAIQPLQVLGYAFWEDNPDPERMFFVKGLPPSGPRTHHIHLVEPESILWERLIFRDYLCKNPGVASRYAQLKHSLAAQFACDREAYTAGKADFVQVMTQKAKQWHAERLAKDA